MSRTTISMIAVSAALLAALPAIAQPSWPDLSIPAPVEGGGSSDAAIVIGIENYTYVEDIPGAVQNANDWYAWLTRTRKVPLGKVALLRDNDAYRESLLAAVGTTVDKVGDGGTVWLVFIGHGAPSKDGTDGLLLGVDTMQTADSVYARGLTQLELLDVLELGSQERTIVVLDACFSGKTGYGDALVDGLQPLVPRYAVETSEATVISAGRADQFAGPLPGVARPAFSYLLLGGLRGWADADGDRQVTPNEAVSYANDAMYALLRDRTQNPQLQGPGGDTVVSRGGEQGPDLTSMVLAHGASIAGATGSAGSVSTGLDVDVAAKAREAEQLRREREALEQREREIQEELDADRARRRAEAESDLLGSAHAEWLALAPLLESPSPEAADVVELYVLKYDEASVSVDGDTTAVEVAQVVEARQWLRRHAGELAGGGVGEPASDPQRDEFAGDTTANPRGLVDMIDVERVLRSITPAAQACYSRVREDKPDLEGTMTLDLTLTTNGRISTVSIDLPSSSLVDADLKRCVERQIRSRQYPHPQGGTVTFSYPFRFEP